MIDGIHIHINIANNSMTVTKQPTELGTPKAQVIPTKWRHSLSTIMLNQLRSKVFDPPIIKLTNQRSSPRVDTSINQTSCMHLVPPNIEGVTWRALPAHLLATAFYHRLRCSSGGMCHTTNCMPSKQTLLTIHLHYHLNHKSSPSPN